MEEQTLNRHQKNRLRTRRKLEQAVFDLLLEKGYEAITIQDIVDRADLGRGTFYIHFHDKEEVLWSLIERGLTERDLLAHEAAVADPSKATLRAAFSNMFHHLEENRDLFRIMLGEKGTSQVTLNVQDWMANDFEREISLAFAKSAPEGLELKVTAQIMTGAIARLAIWWLENPDEGTAEEIAELGYRTLTSGFDWA